MDELANTRLARLAPHRNENSLKEPGRFNVPSGRRHAASASRLDPTGREPSELRGARRYNAPKPKNTRDRSNPSTQEPRRSRPGAPEAAHPAPAGAPHPSPSWIPQ